ncbi:MAG: DNA recombination protein RmuC [Reinekea sp.]
MNDWLVLHPEASLLALFAGILLSTIIFSVVLYRQRKGSETQARELQQIQSENQYLQKSLNEQGVKNTRLQQLLNQQQVQLVQEQRTVSAMQSELKQIEQLNHRLAEREQQLDSSRKAQQTAETKLVELAARRESENTHYQEQMQLLNDNKEQLKKEFSHLANEIFEQKQQRFTEQSTASVSALLEPFNKQIEQFRKRVDDIHTKDTEGRSQLMTQLSMLKDMNSQLNKQADDLTKALKGDKKLQGNWGELQIERILESSGLQKGREYEREASFKDEQGNNKRPDFIIHLPDGKHIIIDSKVSLNAYQYSVTTDDDSERERALKEHVLATRNHIRSLSEKNYPKLSGMNSPDFVLMFMPIESAFVAAFESDPNLFNDAFERHIVVVTPTTLLATLRTVANLWVLERQNENAKELYALAGKIFDKFVIFSERMTRLGQQISTVEKTYADAYGSLSEGRGSMVSYVNRLKEIGAPTNKRLPETMLPKDSPELSDDDTES